MIKAGKQLLDFSCPSMTWEFSSFLKTVPVMLQCFWVPALLKSTLLPAPTAGTKLIFKLRLRRLSQLLHQSLHTRKTSVTEQENYI